MINKKVALITSALAFSVFGLSGSVLAAEQDGRFESEPGNLYPYEITSEKSAGHDHDYTNSEPGN